MSNNIRLGVLLFLLIPSIQIQASPNLTNTVEPFLISKQAEFPNYTENYKKTVLEPHRAAQKALIEQARVQAEQQAKTAYVAPVPVYGGNNSGLLAKIKMCESGGNYRATNGSHFGAYQFDIQTWNSVGGSASSGSDIMNSPPNEQDVRAQTLFNQRGTQPWEASRFCWQY